MSFNWRLIFIVLAGVIAVVVGFGIAAWDPVKALCVAVLALAVACFPANP